MIWCVSSPPSKTPSTARWPISTIRRTSEGACTTPWTCWWPWTSSPKRRRRSDGSGCLPTRCRWAFHAALQTWFLQESVVGVSAAGERGAHQIAEHQGEGKAVLWADYEPDRLQESGAAQQGGWEVAWETRRQLQHSVAFYRRQYEQKDCYQL